MDLDQSYPSISDLAARAKRRLPAFVWEYFDSATGSGATQARNRAALDNILFNTAILAGEFEMDLGTRLMGSDYALPFGIAPVGMSGLIWEDAERRLARLGRDNGIPYTLSTVASQTPEAVGPHVGDQGWFQLYPPRDPKIRRDMLDRVSAAGFHTLVLTADVPVASRRERQRKGGMTSPPRLTPRLMVQAALHPAWSLGMARVGMPRMRFMESYSEIRRALPSNQHIGYLLRTSPDWDYLRNIREMWDGPLVVKGVLLGEDARRLVDEGVDGVWVSNHAGRQFDGSPGAIEALPEVRAAVGPEFPLIFDGGIAGGLDILRALAMGADFVMMGRAWHFGLAAFGEAGAAQVVHILREDLKANLGQLGLSSYKGLAARLRQAP